MATKVTMPKLGLTMTEGKMVEWRKKEGETVTKGEILFVIETEKVTFEVEAPDSGVLAKIIAHEGDVLPVGGLLGYIIQPGETLVEEAPAAGAAPAAASAPVQEAGPVAPRAEAKGLETAKISPVARKMAEELGLDVSTIKGTGPGGRIVREDIEKAIQEAKARPTGAPAPAAAKAAPARGKVVPMSSIRKVIARRMVESWQTTPHFQLTLEVDATRLIQARQLLMKEVEQESSGIRLTFTDLLIKIVAQVLEEMPEINVSYTPEGLLMLDTVDIGLVADLEGKGLIVPVLRQANKKTLAEVTKMRADLTTRARAGKLAMDEMTGSSFTISNLGMFPIDQFCAIINPPEAAVLAIGRTIEKPVVVKGQVVVQSRMSMTMGIDHRVLDGVMGSRFLGRVQDIIGDPSILFPQLKGKM